MDEPFYWLDDYPMIAEKIILKNNDKLDSLIEVNLNNIGELAKIKETLLP